MSPWTDEKITLLIKLWSDERKSASRCAAELGVTRNAVIGKVHRLHLPARRATVVRELWNQERRAKAQAKAAQREKRNAKRNLVNPMVARLKAPPEDVFKPDPADLAVGAWNPLPNSTPVGIMDLSQATCRWPVSDGAPFLFCGCQVAEGSSYCPTHKHIGTGKGTTFEQNAVKDAKRAAKRDKQFRDWLEAA